jgi:hypothetical protein
MPPKEHIRQNAANENEILFLFKIDSVEKLIHKLY